MSTPQEPNSAVAQAATLLANINHPRAVPRATRKKTRRACTRCRNRKVRCDSTGNNIACTNCRLDEVECHVDNVTTRRRQRPSLARLSSPASMTIDHESDASRGTSIENANSAADQQAAQQLSPLAQLYNQPLPAFIRPPSSRMSPLNVRFLSDKGALSVPSVSWRRCVWQAYLRSVHPFMPLLDAKSCTVMMHEGKDSGGQLSLLLFHAIMLAGIQYVDIGHLRAIGYTSRKACVHDVFEIVKLLYDMDYEQDRICLIQSLLLMTMWYRSPDDHKDPWHYVGLAVSLAKKSCFHQASTIAAADASQQPLLRRLWWCCVMRDYMVAYGMSRPVHIRLHECTVSMLTVNDLDDYNLPVETLFQVDNHQPKTRCASALCVDLVKLCRIGHTHLERQDFKGLVFEGSNNPTAQSHVNSEQTDLDNEIAQKSDTELSAWFSDVFGNSTGNLPFLGTHEPEYDPLDQYRSLLYMMYHTAIITVHRGHLVPSDGSIPESSALTSADISRRKVQTSAREVTTICERLQARNLMRHLPIPSMTCILMTTIVHLLEIKFAGDHPPAYNVQSLAMFSGIMKETGTAVSYMEWTYQFLKSACETARIPLTTAETEALQAKGQPSLCRLTGSRSVKAVATGAMSEMEASHPSLSMFGFTPPPDQEPILLAQAGLGPAAGLPSPTDDHSFDMDYPLLESPFNSEWPFSLDTAGRDLPMGYGETINTYLIDPDTFPCQEPEASIPFMTNPYQDDTDAHMMGNTWDSTDIDYVEGILLS